MIKTIKYRLIVNLCLTVSCVLSKNAAKDIDLLKFPPNFLFGAATSAYQTEGGWNADGKGPSTWDTDLHIHPEIISDRTNGDIAADSYHLFDQDLKIIKKLGLNHYRFSISWARILPTGDISSVNQAGVDYYNMMIDKLIANNIKPMITMLHFDLPDELQKLGGVLNPYFVKYFSTYAMLLFDLFADRVKLWLTINEPKLYCVTTYGMGILPPGINASGIGDYLCGENILKAHTTAYWLYKKFYYEKFGGKIGIPLDAFVFYARNNNQTVINDRAMQFNLGWFANPLFSKDGNYPKVMRDSIDRNSEKEGRAWSRLPDLDTNWVDAIKGSCDYLGLNYYTARYTKSKNTTYNITSPSFLQDVNLDYFSNPKWPAGNSWLLSVPRGIRDLLRWIKSQYGNIEVIITENGWSDNGEIDDIGRMDYLKEHLREILKAIHVDRCNVTGYTHWSLLDSFEWKSGFKNRFGLYSVNFNSSAKERIPKKSAILYKSIIKNRQIL